jgi:hypothetical protein
MKSNFKAFFFYGESKAKGQQDRENLRGGQTCTEAKPAGGLYW